MVANVTGHRKQGHVPSLPLLCPPAVHPVLGDVWALGFHLHLLGILEKLGRQPGLRRARRALCVTELRGHSLTAAGGRRAGGGWGCLGPQPSLRDHFGGWRDWTWRGRLPDPYVSVFFEDS